MSIFHKLFAISVVASIPPAFFSYVMDSRQIVNGFIFSAIAFVPIIFDSFLQFNGLHFKPLEYVITFSLPAPVFGYKTPFQKCLSAFAGSISCGYKYVLEHDFYYDTNHNELNGKDCLCACSYNAF